MAAPLPGPAHRLGEKQGQGVTHRAGWRCFQLLLPTSHPREVPVSFLVFSVSVEVVTGNMNRPRNPHVSESLPELLLVGEEFDATREGAIDVCLVS